jgi:hypothetical protein
MSSRTAPGTQSMIASMKARVVASKAPAMISRACSLPSAERMARMRVKRAPPPTRSSDERKAGTT